MSFIFQFSVVVCSPFLKKGILFIISLPFSMGRNREEHLKPIQKHQLLLEFLPVEFKGLASKKIKFSVQNHSRHYNDHWNVIKGICNNKTEKINELQEV